MIFTAVIRKTNLVNEFPFCRFLTSAVPVRTNLFSDYSVTNKAISNLIVVGYCLIMELLMCEMILESDKNCGRGTQNKLS